MAGGNELDGYGKNGLTPLSIIAMLLGIAEIAITVGAIQTTGGIQWAFTSFAIIFPVGIAGAFFAILWYKAWVLYPPSEYKNHSPKEFIDAIRVIKLPTDSNRSSDERFQIFADIISFDTQQVLIALRLARRGMSVRPRPKMFYHVKHFGYDSSAQFSGYLFFDTLKESGLVVMGTDDLIWLTDEGNDFCNWLIKNGKKVNSMKTSWGGWDQNVSDGSWSNVMTLDAPL